MVRWFEVKFQVQRLVYIKPLTSIRNFLNTSLGYPALPGMIQMIF